MTARVIFMGTPDFAVPSLEALAAMEGVELVQVISQPDRPAGRGKQLRPSSVSVRARELGLPLWTPETLRDAEAVELVAALEPDVIVVVAYGEILRRNVLEIPPKGIVNVHASLLPRHRGASPVAGALLAGDRVTGVTIMLMDEGMDTGPIIARREMSIRADHDRGTLGEELAVLGAELLAETLPRWLSGEVEPEPQDDSRATKTRLLKKKDGRLDWSRPARELVHQVRGLNPWPGTRTQWNGRSLRILAASLADPPSDGAPVAPGTVVAGEGGVAIATGDGWLRPERLQLAGKRSLDLDAFVNGYRDFVGSRLERADD